MDNFEEKVKEKLGLEFVKCERSCCGTNKSMVLETDEGHIFAKFGNEELVVGEFESLKAISSTNTISTPKPICVIELRPNQWALLTSFVEMGRRGRNASSKLAKCLGELHMHNPNLIHSHESDEGYIGREVEEVVTKFGFHVPTCCGTIPQNNEFQDDWTTFFIRNRLNYQIERLIEHGDRSLIDKKDLLYRKVEEELKCRSKIQPSLVHGDLWGGNWSILDESGKPVVFDPSASYSDPEFEQGIMELFGGLDSKFLKEYYAIIGKEAEHRKERVKLYTLYHLLNHWNHFGGSYKMSALSLIEELIR